MTVIGCNNEKIEFESVHEFLFKFKFTFDCRGIICVTTIGSKDVCRTIERKLESTSNFEYKDFEEESLSLMSFLLLLSLLLLLLLL